MQRDDGHQNPLSGEHPSSSSFGERFKAVFGNLQNQEIAALLGVSSPAVTAYCKGRIPPAEKLVRTAEYTGCNLHWLLTGAGPKRVIYEDKQSDRAKTILFHCDKGGVGKSTAALLTAVGLAGRGYKTLLVDTISGSITQKLFHELLEDKLPSRLEDDLKKVSRESPGAGNFNSPEREMFFETPVKGLDLVSFNAMHQLMLTEKKVRQIDLLPREMPDLYSFIVVDGSLDLNSFGSISLFMTLLLREANVIIPFQPYNARVENIRTTLEYVGFAQSYYKGIEFLGLFVNNYDSRISLDGALCEEIELLVGEKLLNSTIHQTYDLPVILHKGLTYFYQTKSKFVREYDRLVTEILERVEQAEI